jgi:23S rRNA U2552 (ribose-2'-O)-methylase RlmE/FtsJ
MDASKGFIQLDRSRSPHLGLAKTYWKSHLKPHDFVIDMTCGAGHDTQFLSHLLPEGMVYSLDIQEIALQKAKKLLGDSSRVRFLHQSHSEPIPLSLPAAPRLIIYNLGYLPGGDKSITTQLASTLTSLTIASQLLDDTGALSITCYPGHEEGLHEEQGVLAWAKKLKPTEWRVCLHQWINRTRAPSFLWITKA